MRSVRFTTNGNTVIDVAKTHFWHLFHFINKLLEDEFVQESHKITYWVKHLSGVTSSRSSNILVPIDVP